jgi:hypothetical protein
MDTTLQLDILPQPDDTTCGPTCLHAVYRYYGDETSLDEVIRHTPRLEDGGTLAVLLGCDALRRGYAAKIYTYNLQVFDPTWFGLSAVSLADRLAAQMEAKPWPKLQTASRAYLEFLQQGGTIQMEDLNAALIRRYLARSHPILTGLSATFLYRSMREFGTRLDPDDVRGVPSGHFVVLYGYDRTRRLVRVADPWHRNPLAPHRHYYEMTIDRVIGAILLGILTHDANLLIVRPRSKRKR